MDALTEYGARSRSFLLDVPGFGVRGRPACRPDVKAVADTVLDWLEAVVAGEPVVLIGHSSGAHAALRVALRSAAVRSLVLIGPPFPPEQRTVSGLLRAALRDVVHEPLSLVRALAPYYIRGGPIAVARYLISTARETPERSIADVACPVLLVRGEHDAFAPRHWVDRLASTARCGQSVTFSGAHSFPFQH